MKIIEISTHLDVDPDRVWIEVNKPCLLLFVARPLVRFEPIDPQGLPDRWQEKEYVFQMWLYGIIPLGRQTISISRPTKTPNLRELRDNGYSALIKRWDHVIAVEADGSGTRYTDRIEIDAGFFTLAVTAFARRFYAHRQRRWHKLVSSGFDYSQT